jgi:hypothetical protein
MSTGLQNPCAVVKVRGVADAEDRSRKLILERHPKARRILFKRVEKNGNSWLMKGTKKSLSSSRF